MCSPPKKKPGYAHAAGIVKRRNDSDFPTSPHLLANTAPYFFCYFNLKFCLYCDVSKIYMAY